MMSLRVIIPSWSRISPELESETGCQHSAFIPLGGKALYRHIIDQYQDMSNQLFVKLILPREAPSIDNSYNAKVDFETILLDKSLSIGNTILAGLQGIGVGEPVVVNMADTLVKLDKEIELDCIYTDLRSDLYRWTSVILNSNGTINFPSDRDYEKSLFSPQDICVGVFSFSDGHLLKIALERAIHFEKKGIDPFFTAVDEYSNLVKMTLCQSKGWFDCGHVDTYYESRLSYQNLRHFNSLSYDSVKAQVTKTSSNKEQFRHQVRWYKQVPNALSAFLPRIFDSSDGDEPYITMELLSIPTLADIFVTERISLGAWNGVVRTIAYIKEELGRFTFQTSLAPELARSMYIDKTRSRLEQFVRQDPLALKYQITGKHRSLGLITIFDELDNFVEKSRLLDIDSLSPIHGDFCFSNLLYDAKVKLVKMIDPRGEFTIPGIYGDPRYDLAKLAHSYSNGYDFIVSDRFELDISTNHQIKYTSKMGAYHHQVRHIFETFLLQDINLRQQVLAIQALLFLSMLPLHVDNHRRQLAMLATGLELFDRATWEGGMQ
jgi:hypothetical protein